MSKRDYQRIGWRTCFVCGKMGYAYRYKGLTYVKHPVSIVQAQQLTFTDSSLQLDQKKQSTHYISKRSGRHYAIVIAGTDKRLKSSIPSIPTDRIAVFPGAV